MLVPSLPAEVIAVQFALVKRLSITSALLAAACSKDSTGPVSVNGQWTYNASNLTTGSFTCNVSGTTLSITQSGGTFSGTYSGGTLTCNGSTANVGSGTVVSGTLAGSGVTFNFDTPDWHNTGTVSGASMSGNVTVRLVSGGTTYVLNGTWAASKQ